MKHRIGIIGIHGQYGQWLKNFFETLGHTVIGSDLETELSNAEVVQQSDVVIFSVPIRYTVEVIESVLGFGREDQLWMDVTSVKQKPVEAMMKSPAEVVGLHPMCAPTAPTLKGQIMMRCDGRLNEWAEFVETFMEASEAKVKHVSPEEHDRMMATIQALPHASVLSMAAVLRKRGVNVHDMLESTSAFYRIVWSLMSRILAQHADLYADIQMSNPSTVEILRELEDSLRELRERVEAGERDSFIDDFESSAEHFGKEELKGGYNLFEGLIGWLRK